MIAEQNLPAVIVNPSTPIGPRDVKPTPTGRIIVEAARGRMPGFVDTGLNLVHVDDVADGHLAALARGKIGERYILGGQNVLLSDMLADIAGMTGRRPPRLRMPRRAIFPLAFGAETVARFTGREPFVTMDALRMAKYHMFFNPAKAERELGIKPRPHTAALAGRDRLVSRRRLSDPLIGLFKTEQQLDQPELLHRPPQPGRRGHRGAARPAAVARRCRTANGRGRKRLLDSMRYGSLGGGKRFRPFLVVESASLFGVPRAQALMAGAALEFVHCYSLVHDDLPAMDNDDLRRGRPTAHKAYDEATAILAGDGLLTFAFDVLSRPETHPKAGGAHRAGDRAGARLRARRHGRRPGARSRRRGAFRRHAAAARRSPRSRPCRR